MEFESDSETTDDENSGEETPENSKTDQPESSTKKFENTGSQTENLNKNK